MYDDGFDNVPLDDSGFIRGELFKFKTGEFLLGNTVLNGQHFIVTGVLVAWVEWRDNKPTYHVTEANKRHPERDEWGDLDPAEWPPGLDGDPADPFRDTRHLFLLDRQAREYTFVTSSWGGKKAIGTLTAQIRNMRSMSPAHAEARPVIELAADKFNSPKFGQIWKPLLSVVEWVSLTGGKLQLRAEPPRLDQKPEPKSEAMSAPIDHKTELDDDIPF
jgi:hypothetical protein